MDDAVLLVAKLMSLAARTAPKCMGQDYVETKIIAGEELDRLAAEMVSYGQKTKKANFDRDAENVRRSQAVFLIALRKNMPVGLNCGACGINECGYLISEEGNEFEGPLCAWRVLDVGIALGSAVKVASALNVDNRVMYRVGVVARKMGLINGPLVIGVPVSAYSKNIYFDRGS